MDKKSWLLVGIAGIFLIAVASAAQTPDAFRPLPDKQCFIDYKQCVAQCYDDSGAAATSNTELQNSVYDICEFNCGRTPGNCISNDATPRPESVTDKVIREHREKVR